MAGEKDHALAAASWPEIVQRIRARTPARLLVGRAGSAYPTSTQLELREAHAAARDAVWAELDTRAIFTEKLLDQWKLFEVSTRAAGRTLAAVREELQKARQDADAAVGDAKAIADRRVKELASELTSYIAYDVVRVESIHFQPANALCGEDEPLLIEG